MAVKAIHQFHPSCAVGDGVTNGMQFARRLLRELGFVSDIYCDHIPEALKGEVRPRAELRPQEDSFLLVHHSLGYEDDNWLQNFAGRAALVYHNITPERFLPEEGPWRRLSRFGEEQLLRWRPWLVGACGDSDFNTESLRAAGYDNAVTLPLLVDLQRVQSEPWDADVLTRYRDSTNILFVGRLCANKRQDLLIEAYAEYLRYAATPARLILPGAPISAAHLQSLHDKARALGVADSVELLGAVSNAALYAMYRAADLFVCLSEHEGFGMPLIEASYFGVPVIANSAGSVAATLGAGGLLLDDLRPRQIGALMHMVLSEPHLRRRIRAGQQLNLQRFQVGRLCAGLARFLTSLDISSQPPKAAPALPPSETSTLWKIEGPFDSSYSLAIVNRELARALTRRGHAVALSITPGAGEPEPDRDVLAAQPDLANFASRAELAQPDVCLRFTYPPRTDAMTGRVRVVHTYGWEETAFPQQYVEWFNRKLDLITVLSAQVEKILRDAGIRVPIAVVGAGVDQWQATAPMAAAINCGKSFRFLHISSCFARKGVDALLAAYGASFRAADDVTLVIKTFPNPHNDVAQQLARLRQADPGYPDVVLFDADWPDAEIASLYGRCHAFVAPSRGEGFGMPMAEAMRFGLPVITTAWGGQTDFCTESTAWLCDYRYAQANSHLGLEPSAWAEPDVAHLAALLREVCELSTARPAALAPRLAAARALVAAEYTWDRVAAKTEAAAGALDRLPQLAPEPRIGWVSSWNCRCGIATYSANLSVALPADRLSIFAHRAEQLDTDADNVLRCWDAGLTSRVDELLAAIEQANVGVLVIQYNFGFFPLSELARLIAEAKRDGRQAHLFLHATQDVDKPDFKASLRDIAATLRLADRIYVHGFDDLNRLKSFGLDARAVLFPHGVYALRGKPSDELRQSRGLMGKRVVASYGFLLPHKGQRALLGAFALLVRRRPELHLVLCCALYPVAESVQEKNAILALVKEYKLEGKVTLIDDFLPDEQSLSWLQLAELVVFPYRDTQESASGAARMGIASGRPIAVTPIAIFDDLGEAVHRLPGLSEDEMAQGIARLLDDSALLHACQIQAERYRVVRQWPLLSQRLVNIIDGIANPLVLPNAPGAWPRSAIV